MSEKILLFCDGGQGFGMGHVTRCAALAGEFEKMGLDARLVINGDALIPGAESLSTQEWPLKAGNSLCVVDSYAVSADEIAGIFHAAKSCLWIDDENLRAYPGGTVVNPSLFGDGLDYKNPCRHLLGSRYIILRPEFRRGIIKRINYKLSELTVIMGGADASKLLPEITAAPDCNVVNGRLSASQVAELFIRSDLVISAGGQTVNELIQLNTPMILTEAAKNQRNNIKAAVDRGLAAEYKPGGSLTRLISEMSFEARRGYSRAMEEYDFSEGAGNIAREFLSGVRLMNIQIFGKDKCFETKKAERYFKERGIKFQRIDIVKYGISKGEYNSVKAAVGSMELLMDEKSKEYERQYIKHLAREDDKEERLLENPAMFKTPIVRNGKKATVGYKPEIWKDWE